MSRAQRITSRRNPWFRRFRDAVEHHQDEIALEGPKAIRDAIGLGWRPIAIATDRPSQPLGIDAQLIEFDRKLFAEISDTTTSQGMVALFERPNTELQSLFARAGLIVVLDGLQDPGNVGTIIRLATAFDAAGVALTEGSADPFGPRAVRASAGAVLSVPISRTSRAEFLSAVKKHGFELWAAAASDFGADDWMPGRKAAIAFGSEGRGVSPELLARAKRVWIPISRRVESLNVAAAAAILLSRVYRGTLPAAKKPQ